jgi:hypothetical protein
MIGTVRQLVYDFYEFPEISHHSVRLRNRLLEQTYPELSSANQHNTSTPVLNHSIRRNDGFEKTRLRCRPENSKRSSVWLPGDVFVEQGEHVVVIRSNAAGEEDFALIRTNQGIEGFVRAEYINSSLPAPDMPIKRYRFHDRSNDEAGTRNQVADAIRRRKQKETEIEPTQTLPASEETIVPLPLQKTLSLTHPFTWSSSINASSVLALSDSSQCPCSKQDCIHDKKFCPSCKGTNANKSNSEDDLSKFSSGPARVLRASCNLRCREKILHTQGELLTLAGTKSMKSCESKGGEDKSLILPENENRTLISTSNAVVPNTNISKKLKRARANEPTRDRKNAQRDGIAILDSKSLKIMHSSQSSHETIFQENCCCS